MAIPDFNLSAPARFEDTHWTVVLAAGAGGSPRATQALEQLCTAYWYPLYAHARRRGNDHHAAEDATQAFFAQLLEKQALHAVRPAKGRFRSFLLTSLDNFLTNDWRKGQAAKRGGGRLPVSLEDSQAGEARFIHEASALSDPEKAFDRTWAATVLASALSRLRQDLRDRGREAHFEDWKVFLSREASAADCEASAARLGMTPGAVTVAVHRFRDRYAVLLKETVAHTVPNPSDIDDELRYLFSLLNT